MGHVVDLDVLVVYSAGVALSASVDDTLSKHPFLINSKQSNYNLSYDYFLKSCRLQGLTAGFTTSSDIIGPGRCKCYWTSLNGKWFKNNSEAHSCQIFDKVSPITKKRTRERDLLFSDLSIRPFNDLELFTTFFDKLKTYKKLSLYAIPTAVVRSSKFSDIESAVSALNTLKTNHCFSDDFSASIVLKDRFGAGGNYVYKIENDFAAQIHTIMKQNSGIHFLIQPFLKFDRGFSFKNNTTSTDLRLIYLRDSLIQTYVRMACDKDFRCNEHQGGKLVYVTFDDIPTRVRRIADKIVKTIHKSQSLYALDFVVSNTGHVYFVEGNIGPGIDWDVTKKVNETKSKQLIQNIVEELSFRVRKARNLSITTLDLLRDNQLRANAL